MFCSDCGAETRESAKFCNGCGSPTLLTEQPDLTTKKCPFCAEDIQRGATRCKHCHAELNSTETLSKVISKQNGAGEFEAAIFSKNFTHAIALLPTSQQAAYQLEVDRKRRHIGVAYLYHILLGTFGAAKFYIREPQWGVLYAACTILVIGLVIVGLIGGLTLAALKMPDFGAADVAACYIVGWCSWTVVSIGCLFDLFLIPSQVNKANDRVRQEILIEIGRSIFPDANFHDLPEVPAPTKAIAFGLAGVFLTTGFLVVLSLTASHLSNRSASGPESPTTTPSPIPSPTPNPVPTPFSGAATTETSSTSPMPTQPSSYSNDQPTRVQSLDAAVQADLDKIGEPNSAQAKDAVGATASNKAGLAGLKSKDYSQAAISFAQAVASDPSNAKYESNLGFAQMMSGDLDSAKTSLLISLKLDAGRAVAWGDLAEVYAKQGKRDAAVSCLLKGFDVSNGETLPYLNSLDQDPDQSVVEAGRSALAKLTLADFEEADAAALLLAQPGVRPHIEAFKKVSTDSPWDLSQTSPHLFECRVMHVPSPGQAHLDWDVYTVDTVTRKVAQTQ